ncbi:MAG: ThiF family adenylyltransferase [Lacipirellulaceae bacterium]
MHSDRFERQRELVPSERLFDLEATVIGVGAIGRQVALQLASLGMRTLHLVDYDVVEAVNITTQGYLASDLGKLKVNATEQAVLAIDPRITVNAIGDRFRSYMPVEGAVFCCVDSISARESIWRSVAERCQFWADGRMRGEVLRVLTSSDSISQETYRESLFPQREAQAGACTSGGTIYTAAIAAGLMLSQFVRWLRGQPVEADQSLNLLSSELVLGAG